MPMFGRAVSSSTVWVAASSATEDLGGLQAIAKAAGSRNDGGPVPTPEGELASNFDAAF